MKINLLHKDGAQCAKVSSKIIYCARIHKYLIVHCFYLKDKILCALTRQKEKLKVSYWTVNNPELMKTSKLKCYSVDFFFLFCEKERHRQNFILFICAIITNTCIVFALQFTKLYPSNAMYFSEQPSR